MQSTSVIVLLLLIAASCIARCIRNELNFRERLNSLIGEHEMSNESCTHVVSVLRNYQLDISGAAIENHPLLHICDVAFTYFANLNPSNFNSTSRIYTLNDKITTICLPDKEFDYQATGHIYLGDYTFNGTASLCSNGKDCVSVTISGYYSHIPDESCFDFGAEATLCQQ